MLMKWKDQSFEGNYELYEAGTYLVQIKEIERKASSNGTPQLFVKGVIADGEMKGKSVVDYLAITEAASWRIALFLHKAGMAEQDIREMGDMDTAGEEFMRVINLTLGRYMYWELTVDTYQGKTRNKVASFMAYDQQEALVYSSNVPEWVRAKNHGLTSKTSKPATPEQRELARKAGLI